MRRPPRSPRRAHRHVEHGEPPTTRRPGRTRSRVRAVPVRRTRRSPAARACEHEQGGHPRIVPDRHIRQRMWVSVTSGQKCSVTPNRRDNGVRRRLASCQLLGEAGLRPARDRTRRTRHASPANRNVRSPRAVTSLSLRSSSSRRSVVCAAAPRVDDESPAGSGRAVTATPARLRRGCAHVWQSVCPLDIPRVIRSVAREPSEPSSSSPSTVSASATDGSRRTGSQLLGSSDVAGTRTHEIDDAAFAAAT